MATVDVEKIILSEVLQCGEISDTWNFAESKRINHQAVIDELKTLLTTRYVLEQPLNSSVWTLTNEGNDVVNSGSAEVQVFRAITKTGMKITELNSTLGEVAKTGISICLKNKWIRKKGDLVSPIVWNVEDETAKILISIRDNNHSLSEDDLKNLKKRNLIEQTNRKSFKITRGPAFNNVYVTGLLEGNGFDASKNDSSDSKQSEQTTEESASQSPAPLSPLKPLTSPEPKPSSAEEEESSGMLHSVDSTPTTANVWRDVDSVDEHGPRSGTSTQSLGIALLNDNDCVSPVIIDIATASQITTADVIHAATGDDMHTQDIVGTPLHHSDSSCDVGIMIEKKTKETVSVHRLPTEHRTTTTTTTSEWQTHSGNVDSDTLTSHQSITTNTLDELTIIEQAEIMFCNVKEQLKRVFGDKFKANNTTENIHNDNTSNECTSCSVTQMIIGAVMYLPRLLFAFYMLTAKMVLTTALSFIQWITGMIFAILYSPIALCKLIVDGILSLLMSLFGQSSGSQKFPSAQTNRHVQRY